MIGHIAAQFCAAGLQLVGWLAAQPIASMWSVPALLLAIAPAWYFRYGYRIPQVLFHTPKIQRQSIVYTLLVLELCLSSHRSKLYVFSPFFAFLFGPFATFCIFVTSLAMVTALRRLANTCFDTLLIIDNISSFLFLFNSSFSFTSLMLFTLSTSRSLLFLAEDAWYTSVALYQEMKRNPALVAGIESVWKSSFYFLSTENLDGLGDEFNSQSLCEKFTQVWARLKDEAIAGRRLFSAIILTLRWDLCLVCVARTALAVATLAQAPALSYFLRTVENKDSTVLHRALASCIITLVFACYVVIRQMATTLTNRLVVFVRGILFGQIQNKTLRLSATNARDETASTLMDTDVGAFVDGIPDILELVAGAIEIGAVISYMSGHWGAVSFTAIIPALCTIIPSSKLFRQLSHDHTAWANRISNRASASIKILSGMRVMKIMGIDVLVVKYLEELYESEMQGLRSYRQTQGKYILIMATMDKFTEPFVLFCAVLYTTLGSDLQPSSLFPTLLVLNMLKTRLIAILRAYQRYMAVSGPYNRIQNYLNAEEFHATTTSTQLIHVAIKHCMFNDSPVDMNAALLAEVRKKLPNTDPLQLLNATVTLPGATTPAFTNVSISVPSGKLTIVIGIKGSGKSDLLRVLLGEVSRSTGDLYLQPGVTIAFCGQPVWLQHQSIRQNIVGDYPFQRSHYDDVLRRCQLSEDLQTLPERDNTILGTEIASLTASQQCKMALAKMAYSNTSVVLVDNLLSLLDETTADKIFNALFSSAGLLHQQGRTSVVATHRQKYLADAELAIFLDGNGHVVTREAGAKFALVPRLHSIITDLSESREAEFAQRASDKTWNQLRNVQPAENMPADEIQQEEASAQASNFRTLLRLIPRQLMIACLSRMIFMASIERVPDMFASFWLADDPHSKYYQLIFVSLGALCILANGMAFGFWFQQFCPESLTILHTTVLKTVLNSELSSLDMPSYATTVNDLNKHMTKISQSFSIVSSQIVNFGLIILVEMTIVGIVSGLITPILLAICVSIYLTETFYHPYCERLQKHKEAADTTFFTHHNDIASCIEQIRTSRSQDKVNTQGLRLLDKSQASFYHVADVKRWTDLIVDSVSSIITVTIAVMSVYRGTISASTAGLAIVITAAVSGRITMLLTLLAAFKTLQPSMVYLLDFVANNRTELVEEVPDEPVNWSGVGDIVLRNVTATYETDNTKNTAINKLYLSVRSGEKLALVGPSGSGKTSLIHAILNCLPYTGSIKIGGVETLAIPLQELRSRITTCTSHWLELPGNIGQNLMPWRFDEGHEDHIDIGTAKKVLVDTELWEYIQKMGGLLSPMQDTELSEDQRTRFSLARLIFHHLQYRNKVVIIDDFMTNVDETTRRKLTQLVSKYFSTSTVLMLCDDINSVGDVDVVRFIENGRIENPGTSHTENSRG